jgi:hypothetical protein
MVTNTVPTDVIENYKIINLDIDQYNILICFDISNLNLILENKTGFKIKTVVCTRSSKVISLNFFVISNIAKIVNLTKVYSQKIL